MPVGIIIVNDERKIKFANSDMATLISSPLPVDSSSQWLSSDRPRDVKRTDSDNILSQLDTIVEIGEEGHSLRSVIVETNDDSSDNHSYHMVNKESRNVYEVKTKYLPILSSKGHKLVVVKDQTIYEQVIKERSMKKYQRILLASITHEIRNPLNSIMGYLTTIAETENLAEAKQAGEYVRGAVEQIRYIVASSCDLTMIDSSTLVIEPSAFDLRGAIENVINVIRPNLEAKPITLHITQTDAVPDPVHSDQKRYELIMFHLLSNAVKYTMEGEIKVAVDYDDRTGLVKTSVADTGVGMSPDSLSKLYQLYANVDKANPYNPQGMGFGLTLCKRLSRLLGGDIEARSLLGKGSTFEFTVANVMTTEQSQRLEGQIKEEGPDGDLRQSVRVIFASQRHLAPGLQDKAKDIKACSCPAVLVVDDDAANRSVLKSFLKAIDATADEAENGLAAIGKVKERLRKDCCQRYSLILMDINMPIMDGTTATEELMQLFAVNPAAKASIVAVTAANLESYSEVHNLLSVGFSKICKF